MAEDMTIPAGRRAPLERIRTALASARSLVLTTHVNADGDGAGCEAALAAWLRRKGKDVAIANPTPFPETYRFLLEAPDTVVDPADSRAASVIQHADLFVVLDTSEPKRIGKLARAIAERPAVIIDHHPPSEGGISGIALQDPGACATGELLYDLLLLDSNPASRWPQPVVEGLYSAIVTDTGSFRFANTSPRAHRIVADLIQRGVDPEVLYRRLFGTVPLRRVVFLRSALEHLEVDELLPISWISIPRKLAESSAITSEDLDGIVEYARSIEGTEVALLFRETSEGGTKVSWRSNGDVDVNALARQFGGGGHVKAAGALIGGPLERVRAQVLEATRGSVRALEQLRASR